MGLICSRGFDPRLLPGVAASDASPGPITHAEVRALVPVYAQALHALAFLLGVVLSAAWLPLGLLLLLAQPFARFLARRHLWKVHRQDVRAYPLENYGVSEASWGSPWDAVMQPVDLGGTPATWWDVFWAVALLPWLFQAALLTAWSSAGYLHTSLTAAAGEATGWPLGTAPAYWRIAVAFPIRIISLGGSRVAAAAGERRRTRRAVGDEALAHWWHGQSVWTGTHAEVDAMMRGPQRRTRALSGFRAVAGDLFAASLLIFLPNDRPGPAGAAPGSSAWAAIRSQVHKHLLSPSLPSYRSRVRTLSAFLTKDWARVMGGPPAPAQLKDDGKAAILVAKAVFYLTFGAWVDDEDAAILAQWRSLAADFVMPRLVDRMGLRTLVTPVQSLRLRTTALLLKHQAALTLEDMNRELGPWRRPDVATLSDEVGFVVGFAGIGGTTAAVWSTGHVLCAELSSDADPKHTDLGGRTPEQMVALYRSNARNFVKETCRLMAPVGDISFELSAPRHFPLFGTLPEGTLVSGAINLANRDPAAFRRPELFDPSRPDLNRALTWNGQAFGPRGDDRVYPRICPGREMALEVATAVCNIAIGEEPAPMSP